MPIGYHIHLPSSEKLLVDYYEHRDPSLVSMQKIKDCGVLTLSGTYLSHPFPCKTRESLQKRQQRDHKNQRWRLSSSKHSMAAVHLNPQTLWQHCTLSNQTNSQQGLWGKHNIPALAEELLAFYSHWEGENLFGLFNLMVCSLICWSHSNTGPTCQA